MVENRNQVKRKKSGCGKCCCAISTVVIIIALGVAGFVYREAIVEKINQFSKFEVQFHLL